ncbi:NTP transferase domain-containing protein [Candidatus Kaiserbacteria bacterium]|nr:NTP transferase domain-containing protein [Candidatus Kaiserbacteria bacterium]
MRILIDLDGTICELRKKGQDYSDVRINPQAVERLRTLKAAGHYIILQTARHMKTCSGDQGQVVAKIGKKTLDWLARHEIPYDEIYFGKPYADVYLDDNARTFISWEDISAPEWDTERVNILIPMAGRGSRFAQAGFTDPKPLIPTHGATMVEWAMRSFDFLKQIKRYKLIFIILKEHDEKYKLSTELKRKFGQDTVVIAIDEVTRGQAETCLAATSHIDNYNQLFIYNCDTYSTSKIWDLIQEEKPDGVIPVFTATDPRYSYAKVDEYGYVQQTAEKRAISDQASTGMYYFKRGSDFVRAAEKMIATGEMHNGEFYVIPCYNELLKSGKNIRTIPVDDYWVLGTPEELETFNKNFKG